MEMEKEDPRRKRLIEALKRKSGASKVTGIEELPDGSFRGQCFRVRLGTVMNGSVGSQLLSIGFYTVTAQDAGL